MIRRIFGFIIDAVTFVFRMIAGLFSETRRMLKGGAYHLKHFKTNAPHIALVFPAVTILTGAVSSIIWIFKIKPKSNGLVTGEAFLNFIVQNGFIVIILSLVFIIATAILLKNEKDLMKAVIKDDFASCAISCFFFPAIAWVISSITGVINWIIEGIGAIIALVILLIVSVAVWKFLSIFNGPVQSDTSQQSSSSQDYYSRKNQKLKEDIEWKRRQAEEHRYAAREIDNKSPGYGLLDADANRRVAADLDKYADNMEAELKKLEEKERREKERSNRG